MPSKPQFALCDQNAGIFAEICRKNGITHCWLQWKFELAVLNQTTSPLTIDTKSDPLCDLKSGVNKVIFTIDFDQKNPNMINYVKFSESYDDCEKKHFIVTRTSIDHVHEDTGCNLWLEVPAHALHEDIGAVVSLWKVEICCDGWKDFLPACPVTQLERAHRVVSAENVGWLKKQLMQREGLLIYKDRELATKARDIENLTTQIGELSMQLAEVEQELEDNRVRDLVPAGKRKILTPKSRVRKVPRTAPAKSLATRASEVLQTPTKRSRFVLEEDEHDDPFGL